MVGVLKQAIRLIKQNRSKEQYGALRVIDNRAGLIAQLKSVSPYYLKQDTTFMYKP